MTAGNSIPTFGRAIHLRDSDKALTPYGGSEDLVSLLSCVADAVDSQEPERFP